MSAGCCVPGRCGRARSTPGSGCYGRGAPRWQLASTTACVWRCRVSGRSSERRLAGDCWARAAEPHEETRRRESPGGDADATPEGANLLLEGANLRGGRGRGGEGVAGRESRVRLKGASVRGKGYGRGGGERFGVPGRRGRGAWTT
eukprot:1195694-Prorocentrum_minimum.AAC.4